MSTPRVSIKDIARVAGVSHSTVSRALNDSPLISTEVRERIQALAAEMGYTPNAVARSLQTHRTQTIGVVVTSIGDPFFVEIMEGIEEVALPGGLSVFLNSSHNDPDQEIQVIESFDRRRVDGIIVAASRVGTQHAERLAYINRPVVLINGQATTDRELFHSVGVDDRAGARLAVKHLLSLGHRRIAYLGVSNRPRSNQRRRDTYVDALSEAGITPDKALILTAACHDDYRQANDVALGQAMVEQLLESDVTALFCYNDMVAVGALVGCRTHGVRVPEALSVIGFDDVDITRYVMPSLTTIHQPKRQLGQRGMQMMLDLLEGRGAEDQTLKPSLVVRESTAPPRSERSLGQE